MPFPVPRVIALYSSAPRSGKTTVAEHLCKKYGYTRVSFASPLKAMADTFLAELGYPTEARGHMLHGDLKEVALPRLGVTPRRILQTLGTEWGRDLIARDVWVEAATQRIVNASTPVVVDDMRFANEYQALLALGAVCMRVVRPVAHGQTETHASEGALDGRLFNFVIDNSHGLPELRNQIDQAMWSVSRGE